MTDNRFIQLHMLVSYPPSNPNRDDLGQPKTAIMGGTQRSRISSQSLKRAWRTSETWKNEGLKIGTRTRELFLNKDFGLYDMMVDKFGEENAEKFIAKILGKFTEVTTVKLKEDDPQYKKFNGKKIVTKQPIHFSDSEVDRIKSLVAELEKEPTDEQLENILDSKPRSIDLAMFGRMIAKHPDRNVEAAVQVSHAISINEIEIEDDFFTAVDDLNRHGSAHMNEQQFVSAIYYLYLCIDTDSLLSNLGKDNKEQAQKALKALVRSAATVAPSGKQNSYGNNVEAFYILAEKGNVQPRNLSLAFLKALSADAPESAIEKLSDIKEKFNQKYEKPTDEREMNLFGKGKLEDILNFVGEL